MMLLQSNDKQIKDLLKSFSDGDASPDASNPMYGIDFFSELGLRFGINILAAFILIGLIYYPRHKNKDFLFTFFIFNIVIFIILSTTKIKQGVAFGLFAVFSIMRYRTVTVPIKEMGYFFICLALGMINALTIIDKTKRTESFLIILACNAVILTITILLDRYITLTHENVKEITYERVDLIVPERRDELMDDLKKRTGLPIHRIEVKNVNFLRDTAKVHVFYHARENENRLAMTGDDD
ncbi:MAG TPA: DUF4956 domain-containing protein [Chitinophagaceae bacterium]|nr:DUF4956 domain-containing protein [Chitinophagaceae bacterium]